MSAVRPFVREDLGAVAALYERVVRKGDGPAPDRLVEGLQRALLDHPWAEPDLPSLVYEDASGGIAGFQGAYPRRMTIDGRPVRMVSCGQLVADPDSAALGIGGLLMRRMLSGKQDLTTTDGATREVQAMWTRLGGSTGGITCLGWTKIFHPAQLALHLAARHWGQARLPADSGPVAASSEELTPERLIEQVDHSRKRLRPDYDAAYLEWLFSEMEAVEGRGPLARRLIRDVGGGALGWYVAYLPSSGIAQAIGVGSVRPDAGPVLDRLFSDARAAGASAIQGRAEPGLLPPLVTRRCVFGRSEWALVHYADDQVAAAAGREQVLLTRLDGEWWMGFHLTEAGRRSFSRAHPGGR